MFIRKIKANEYLDFMIEILNIFMPLRKSLRISNVNNVIRKKQKQKSSKFCKKFLRLIYLLSDIRIISKMNLQKVEI